MASLSRSAKRIVDIAQPPQGLLDPKVRYAIGDAADPRFIVYTFGDDANGIFHPRCRG
jgi:hypothetical protein